MSRGAVIPALSPDEVGQFWAQTRRLETGCLEWVGSCNGPRGTSYGLFTIKRDGQRVRLMSHRVALALSTGSDGMFACHHCDNPPCVEPQHLYWGDPKSNAADAISRGRLNSGPNRLSLDPLRERSGRWLRPDAVLQVLRMRFGDDAVVLDELDWMYFRQLDALAANDDIAAFVARVERGDGLLEDRAGDDLWTDARLVTLYKENAA